MLTVVAYLVSFLALQVTGAIVNCVTVPRTNLNLPVGCDKFILSSDGNGSDIVVIDYGQLIEGRPSLLLNPINHIAVLEVAWAESRVALDFPNSDGPIAFSGAQETYRTKRYNVTSTTKAESRLIQGGFRWQKLTLISGGPLEVSDINTISSVETAAIDQAKGQFECSDPQWNSIWKTGARTIQLTNFPAKSIPPFWNITPSGATIEAGVPLPWAGPIAQSLSSYRLKFDAVILNGGFSFKILTDFLSEGVYVWINAANSSISAYFGSTELGTLITTKTISVSQVSSFSVEAQVNSTEISVLLNGSPALTFSQNSHFVGSVGIGAANGQKAIFTNVSLESLDSKTQYYSSSLNTSQALVDFQVGTNPLDASVDGSRRDRVSYAGDLDISAPSAYASSGHASYTNGTLAILASYQTTSGFFIPAAKVQQELSATDVPVNVTGLIGYSWNLILAMADYYKTTRDPEALSSYAPRIVRMLEWSHSQLLDNGLLNISDAAFGVDWNYYDPGQVGTVAKFNALYAYSLQETQLLLNDAGVDTTKYRRQLLQLRQAIYDNLWNTTLKAFYISPNITDGFGQDSNAIALLAHVGYGNQSSNDERQKNLEGTVLNTLRQLSTQYGPLAFSNSTRRYGYAQKISPFASAYHLRAAFQAHDEETVSYLLENLWTTMIDTKNANYSGSFWEVLNPDGTPGLDSSTSLCHAWASAPVAELSRNVLGVTAVEAGYRKWLVAPYKAGLEWAKGEYPTPNGNIKVDWKLDPGNGCVKSLKVVGPKIGSGSVDLRYLLPPTPSNCTDLSATVNGKPVEPDGGSYNLTGDDVLSIQTKKYLT